MAATTESSAVFLARCEQLGLEQVHIDALKAKKLVTYSSYAWSCSYQPYQSDESPFLEMLQKVFGATQLIDVESVLRRLFCEAHALCLQEMRSRCERTDDAMPQRILSAERSSRYEEQKKRLVSMRLTGPHECSNALIDTVIQQYEDNSLRYIALEMLTSREQEQKGQKKDPFFVEYFTKIQAGKLVLREQRVQPVSDISSDLRVKHAWTRRSLAYDQAQLISFLVLEQWVDLLIGRMYEEPPEHYQSVTLEQCISADKKLWLRMGESCRASIIPVSVAGVLTKPLDTALTIWSSHTDVLHLIQPLPRHTGSSGSGARASTDLFSADYETIKVKKPTKHTVAKAKAKAAAKAKSRGKQKGTGKGSTSGLKIPDGCCAKTDTGTFICYAFNSEGGCPNAAVGASCDRGWHVCGRSKCFRNHPIFSCPAAAGA